MAYIGKTPTVGNFQKCDALTASATADYTLQVSSTNVVPESVNHMIVSLNGVIQAPTTAYTVSGSTLSFTSALTSNDTIDFVILLGNVLDIGTPSDGTVTSAKLSGVNEITEADMWRLTADITSDADITSNLERVDDASFEKIGTGMTESSGIFSFATTGLYQIITTLKGNSTSTHDTFRIYVYASTDGGSSYDIISEAALGSASSNAYPKMATNINFVNVTNTTNVKVKFASDSLPGGALSTIEGHTDYNKTNFTFIRLGDST